MINPTFSVSSSVSCIIITTQPPLWGNRDSLKKKKDINVSHTGFEKGFNFHVGKKSSTADFSHQIHGNKRVCIVFLGKKTEQEL